MPWFDYCHGARQLSAIFGENVPELNNVTVRSYAFRGDRSEILIGVDLAEFPEQPPKKWVQQEFDTVRLELAIAEIQSARVGGLLSVQNISIAMSRNSKNQIEIEVGGPQREYMEIRSKFVRVSQMRAYNSAAVKS